jgi:proteasome lid subunit RPN8/RPN11
MKVQIDVKELIALLGLLQGDRSQRVRRTERPRILMTRPAFDQAVAMLASRQPEFAVFLLGPQGHPAITHVVPDTTGEGTPSSFRVGAKRINEVLSQFTPLGLDGKGFWHSHPPGSDRLSNGDLAYVQRLFANPKNDVREVVMPITSDGLVYPFVVRRDNPREALAAELVLF